MLVLIHCFHGKSKLNNSSFSNPIISLQTNFTVFSSTKKRNSNKGPTSMRFGNEIRKKRDDYQARKTKQKNGRKLKV